MKTHPRPAQPAGNTLLIVIVFVGILTLALGSYLALTSGENQSVLRSRCWNAALPLAEAGVEEALSQITKNAGNFSADGWTPVGTNSYTKHRAIGTDSYTVMISGAPNTGITITSTGFVQSVSFRDQNANNAVETGYISRVVQVTAQNSSIPMPVGLVARTSVGFGGNVGVDSYDTSSLATSSTNASVFAMYDSSKRTAQAFVGCVGMASMSLSGNEHIYGYAASGVGALLPNVSGSASIGDFSTGKGRQAGHYTNNFSMSLPDVVPPFSAASAPQTVTNQIHGNNYDYLLKGGNYLLPTLTGMSLYVSNSSVLYVTGDATAAKIVYAPGARLDLYVGGSSVPCPRLYNELPDAGFTLSQAVAPVQFRVLGLNSCTALALSGGGFVGVVYAPYVKINATGNNQVYGALTVDTFNCGGTFDFHYDTSLSNSVSATTLKILSWAEQ